MTNVRAERARPRDGQRRHALRYAVVLRSPQLRAVAAAHGISMFGTVAADAALSLLIYRETKSGLYAALAFSVVFIPQAFSGAFLGGLAGRYQPRTVLVGANAASALLAATMAAPWTPVGWQLTLAAVLGTIVPIHSGTRAAMLVDSLDHDTFLAARSVLRIIAQLAVVPGFVCGGALAASFGPRAVLLGNAASFALAALLLFFATARMPGPRPVTDLNVHPMASVRALRQDFRQSSLRRTALRLWLPISFASAGTGITVAYATQIGQGGTAVGLLLAAFAGGAILGEVCCSRLSAGARRKSATSLILLTQLPSLGFAASPPLFAAILLRALSGSGLAYLQSVDADLLQVTDDATRRRVMIFVSSGVMACQGIAMAVAGAVTLVARPSLVIAGSGAAGVIVCIAALRQRHGRGHPALVA